MSDNTGDKIAKAVQEERERIMSSRPDVTIRIGWTSLPYSQPLVEVTIKGGDPVKSADLGQALASQVLKDLVNLAERAAQ